MQQFLDTTTSGILQLHGPPGVGKSALLRRLDSAREDTIFIDASGEKTAAAILNHVIGASDPRETTSALLVDDIDALDRPNKLIEHLEARALRVILSSRSLHRPDIAHTRLGPVSVVHARQIIEDALGESPPASAQRDITELAAMLDGVPRTLLFIAAQLQHTPTDRLLALAKHDLLSTALDPKAWRFDWSALGSAHRDVLTACTIFRGGFDELALRAITGDERADAMLQELVAMALLEQRDDASFEMLWSVRGLVLHDSVPPEGAHAKHARHFLERAEHDVERPPAFYKPNLREAFEFGLQQDADIAARAAHQLFVSCRERGPLDELGPMLRSALARRRIRAGDLLTVKLLCDLGELCRLERAPESCVEHLEKALALAPPDTDIHVQLCMNMALALSRGAEPQRAIDLARRAVKSCPTSNRALSRRTRSVLGSILGICGEYSEAAAIYDELQRDDLSARLEDDRQDHSALAVSADTRWAWREELGYVDLRRGKISRDLLLALLDHHDAHPGEPCAVSTLFDAAWPGEVWNLSARAKLHTAIHRLRDRLLGELLITHENVGYSLDATRCYDRTLEPPDL